MHPIRHVPLTTLDFSSPEHLEPLLQEAEAQLQPVTSDRLAQILRRLMLHFSCPETQIDEYSQALKHFPEDLLCAAYQHTLLHHVHPAMPSVGSLIGFMEPEMTHRKTILRGLQWLLQRAEAGVGA